jgi:D,D-heptose 1,7-bisphosphate phosphatase
LLTQCVILCGGMGTRLGALTDATPKPMLPISGQPFLEILVQEVARFGFDDIILLAGRHGTKIRDYFHGQTRFGSTIRVLIEPEPQGTGGALRLAAEFLAPEFLLMNGDSWIDTDLRLFAASWPKRRPETIVQMLLQPVSDTGRFGTVEACNNKVQAFREKDPNQAGVPGQINSGIYILDRTIIDRISKTGFVSLETDLLVPLVEEGKVGAEFARDGAYFVDIGVPESYSGAQKDLPLARHRPALFLDRDGTLNRDAGYTHRKNDLSWIEGAKETIIAANRAGWYVFVVTNQAGVAHGMYSEASIIEFHLAMQADLFVLGAHIDAIEWCPHHVESILDEYRLDCRRRKPKPGMIADLLSEWPVDLSRSIMIGDSQTDMLAASNAGVRGIHFAGGNLFDAIGDLLT